MAERATAANHPARPEVASLIAGRDLDAMVAEQVMGFHREGQPKDCDGNFGGEPVLMRPGDSWDSLAKVGFYPAPRGRLALTYFVPDYSTKLDAALQLVAELRRRRLSVVLAMNACAPGQNGCKIFEGFRGLSRSMFETDEIPGWFAVAATLPLAICLAALAVPVEVLHG